MFSNPRNPPVIAGSVVNTLSDNTEWNGSSVVCVIIHCVSVSYFEKHFTPTFTEGLYGTIRRLGLQKNFHNRSINDWVNLDRYISAC